MDSVKRKLIIFDSYIEGSVKDSERARREQSRLIELREIILETKLPKNMEAFWSSAQNKTNLQQLLKTWLQQDGCLQFYAPCLVLSALVIDGEIDGCKVIKKKKGNLSEGYSI